MTIARIRKSPIALLRILRRLGIAYLEGAARIGWMMMGV